MKKRPEIFLEHILIAIEKIERYTEGMNSSEFEKDSKTIDAVVRELEIIGEAAKHIPENMTADSPVAWGKLSSMRNKLIHEYFGVDLDLVWKTAKEGLKPLKRFIKSKLKG